MVRRPVALVLLALLLGAGLLSPQGVASAGPAGRDGSGSDISTRAASRA